MTLPRRSEKRRFVEEMFDRIAPRYDLLNRLATFGADTGWRRLAIASLGLHAGERVLDLGCGTGDLLDLAAGCGAVPVGVDVSAEMLRRARRRVPQALLLRADAERLPLRDASVDAVVSAFALRSFTAVPPVLAEAARVLRPGGRIALLEIDRPPARVRRAVFDWYLGRVVPVIGRVLSHGFAYRYLAESVAYLPPDAALRSWLEAAGFAAVAKRRLAGGAAQLVAAQRGVGG